MSKIGTLPLNVLMVLDWSTLVNGRNSPTVLLDLETKIIDLGGKHLTSIYLSLVTLRGWHNFFKFSMSPDYIVACNNVFYSVLGLQKSPKHYQTIKFHTIWISKIVKIFCFFRCPQQTNFN